MSIATILLGALGLVCLIYALVFLARKGLLVQACFVAAFLPFLRLSAWGSGFNDLSFDTVSLFKTGVRLLTFAILALYVLSKIRRTDFRLGSGSVLMMAFLACAGFSLLYSSNTFYSAYRLVEHVGFFLFALAVMIALPTTRCVFWVVLRPHWAAT